MNRLAARACKILFTFVGRRDDLEIGRGFHQRTIRKIVTLAGRKNKKKGKNQPDILHQHEADRLRLLLLFPLPRCSLSFPHQSLLISM